MTITTNPELPTLHDGDVKLLRHHNFYDYPLSGELVWEGKRYWFEVHYVEGEDGPWVDGFMDVVDLTDEQWKPIDELTELFNRHVGSHCEYDPETGRRNVMNQKSHANSDLYYEDHRVKEEVWQPKGKLVAYYEMFPKEK